MNEILISLTIFAVTLAGSRLGPWLFQRLPGDHLSEDSKDVIKLGTGFVASMAALVISLMISSAKDAFDERSAEITEAATDMIVLDRVLADYGSEAKVARDQIRVMAEAWLHRFWPENRSAPEIDPMAHGKPPLEILESEVRKLSPTTDEQRALQSDAVDIVKDIVKTRWTLYEQYGRRTIPGVFLVVIAIWLTTIFVSFGLFAPRNRTVSTVFVICALSAACAVFLILEMDDPFTGIIRTSSVPFSEALVRLDQ